VIRSIADLRLRIADWKNHPNVSFNPQSAIVNPQSPISRVPIVPHGRSFVGGMIGRDTTATRVCVDRRPTTLFATDPRTAHALATQQSRSIACTGSKRCETLRSWRAPFLATADRTACQ